MFFSLAKKLKKSMGNQRGFTLVELLIIVVIIGILVAIFVPKLLSYSDNARASQAEGDMASMRSIIEAYAVSSGQGHYPTAGSPAAPSGTLGPGADISTVLQAGGIQWTGGSGSIGDAWGNAYVYTAYMDGNNNVIGWSITSAGPNKKAGDSDDIFVSAIYSPQQGSVPSNISDGTKGNTENSH